MEWTIRNHLQGRNVVLIPDADGISNPNVRNQCRALQTLMENNGTGKVPVAHPPVPMDDYRDPNNHDDPKAQKVKAGVFTKDTAGGKAEKIKGADEALGVGKIPLKDFT